MERKIIFKARVGSHLHGTNTPKSDEDFLGIFIPSTEDLLGLQNRPAEWTENKKLSTTARNQKGDVDCKYLALYEFFSQAAQGQSQALEMFFIPDEHVIISTPEWEKIKAHKHLFLSRKGILPIVGFALAQARKATMKGENLNRINTLIEILTIQEKDSRNFKIKDYFIAQEPDPVEPEKPNAELHGVPVKYFVNSHGYTMVRIAGLDFDVGIEFKQLRKKLELQEQKYGSRSRMAAAMNVDPKSATHAFRLVGEAEEFMQTGHITFPRPDKDFLLDVKTNNYFGELDTDINTRIDYIRKELEPNSPLPLMPDYSRINKLCQEMLKEHLFNEFR